MDQSELQNSSPADSRSGSQSSASSSNGTEGAVVDIEDRTAADASNDRASDSTSPNSPVVEVLPFEEFGLEPERYANMLVDRTQISVGLTGVSLKRTRMSGGSGQTQNDPSSVDAGERRAQAVLPVSSTATVSSTDRTVDKSVDSSKTASVSTAVPAQPDPGQDPGEEPDFENIQLFSQFLVGAVAFGVSELMERIHYFDERITENSEDDDLDRQIDQVEENIETLFRYWVIGTLMWGERTALSLSYRTFQKSIGLGSFVWRSADRTTDNFLLRPLRKRLLRLSDALHLDSQARIAEGQIVEKRGRVLAEHTVNDIVGDFIDYLSDNPELVDLISNSGMGLAGNVMDSGRQIGAVTDATVENVIRRIFRRPPREELPPSPFDGKPQTMYDPTKQIQAHEGKSKG